MRNPVWLSEEIVIALQAELIKRHGGLAGLRDRGLLSSVVAPPQNLLAYGEPFLFDFAAAYAFGLARNHPFADGNKRAVLMMIYVFLMLNGYRLMVPEVEAVAVMRELAAGAMAAAELAAWIGANVEEV